jgi:hypothetical protein
LETFGEEAQLDRHSIGLPFDDSIEKNVEIGHFANADLFEKGVFSRTRIDVEPIENQ